MIIDGKIYRANVDTIVKDADGVILLGSFVGILKGDEVKVDGDVYTITKTAVDKALEEAAAAFDKSEARWTQLVAKNFNTAAMSVTNATEFTAATAAVATITAPKLTEAEVALLPAGSKTALTAAETNLATTKTNIATYEVAAVVEAKLVALPAAAAVTLADKADIQEARAAYNALTVAQEALLTSQAKLTAAETAITDLETALGKVNTAKTNLTVLGATGIFDGTNAIELVSDAGDVSYTIAMSTTPAGAITGGTGAKGSAATINKLAETYSFEITVTITADNLGGTAVNESSVTTTKVFVVNVPHTVAPITVTVK